MKWFLKCMRNYANFRGRARRREYWMFVQVSVVCGYAVWFLGMALSGDYGLINNISVLSSDNAAISLQQMVEIWKYQFFHYWYCSVFGLVFLLPGLAVTMRRLHDTGRSGWLLGFYWLVYVFLIVLAICSLGMMQTFGGVFAWLLYGFGLYLRCLVFLIALVVWLCLPGDAGPNKYGPDPKMVRE